MLGNQTPDTTDRSRVVFTGAASAVLAFVFCTGLMSPVSAQPVDPDWVRFDNETSSRLVSTDNSVGAGDVREKDYAVGDVDQDGDDDLVVVRKQPFTSAGKDANVLYMNENGVLTNRTLEYATASDVPGDQGFLTPTNDRDVLLVDLTRDGWLDIITVTTLSDGDPVHLSQPRIYVNLGNDLVTGDWLGFQYQNARIPVLEPIVPTTIDPTSGQPIAHAPRFCSVAAGDIDGDQDIDLYFGDYDSGPFQTLDFNDRLLINDGLGFFTDETVSRFVGTVIVGNNPEPFPKSAFGTSVELEDFNGDGTLDIAKDTALNVPQYVGIAYNNPGSPSNPGTFNLHEAVNEFAPYFIDAGDLNNDGMMDLLAMDDGQDRYHLNQGNDAQGRADFTAFSFAHASGNDPGFPGNTVIADFNQDGFMDVAHADVDVDISGCSRSMKMYRNLGNVPNVTLRSESTSHPFAPQGVHDIAVMDLNQDGFPDMVLGRCVGTEVWINNPGALEFSFPNGFPKTVAANQPATIRIEVATDGNVNPQPGGLEFFVALDGGSMQVQPVIEVSPNVYDVTLPAAPELTVYSMYFEAPRVEGGVNRLPSDAGAVFTVVAGDAVFVDDYESVQPGWTVNTAGLTNGGWERAEPNGTETLSSGMMVDVAPGEDATLDGTFAYVTQNGAAGQAAGATDIDGAQNQLTSPLLDLPSGGRIDFDIWYVNVEPTAGQEDSLLIEISSNDGGNWETVQSVTGTNGWENFGFLVSDHVVPSSQVRVRFTANDNPNNSLTEAGVDNFRAVGQTNSDPLYIAGDIDADSSFDIGDTIALLGALFQGGTLSCDKAADVDLSGDLGLPDVTSHLQALFGTNGQSFPQPFPNCGTDPQSSALSCNSYLACP